MAAQGKSVASPVIPLLNIQDLSGGYGSGTVLHNINLELWPGEMVCVLGPNGAGKTSLLRSIYGLIRIDNGVVLLEGENLLALPSYDVARRGVAHVPEGRGLFGGMTVMENLSVGGFLTRANAARRERLDLVLDLFPALAQRRQQIASTMSGGEQQMVAIGRALMSSPRLLLLDEPSLGLAPKLVDEIFDRIGRIKVAEPDLTVLMVEQRVVEALELCGRGYVLEAGQVVLAGPASELASDRRLEMAFMGDSALDRESMAKSRGTEGS